MSSKWLGGLVDGFFSGVEDIDRGGNDPFRRVWKISDTKVVEY